MESSAGKKKYLLFSQADGCSGRKPCAFFASEKGCKNGANCPFSHDSGDAAKPKSVQPAAETQPIPVATAKKNAVPIATPVSKALSAIAAPIAPPVTVPPPLPVSAQRLPAAAPTAVASQKLTAEFKEKQKQKHMEERKNKKHELNSDHSTPAKQSSSKKPRLSNESYVQSPLLASMGLPIASVPGSVLSSAAVSTTSQSQESDGDDDTALLFGAVNEALRQGLQASPGAPAAPPNAGKFFLGANEVAKRLETSGTVHATHGKPKSVPVPATATASASPAPVISAAASFLSSLPKPRSLNDLVAATMNHPRYKNDYAFAQADSTWVAARPHGDW